MWAGSDSIFFACTSGGVDRQGQIWQYRPSVHEGTPQESAQPGKLELFIESRDNGVMRNCDNLTVAPWGDLFVSEDSPLNDGIARIRPDGSVERFGLHRGGYDEICGVCFSPDGSTLFANVQQAGLTLAITGPWMDRRS
jgi:secreted PhoX family phosphatase